MTTQKDTLLQGLNEDLALEFQALHYTSYAAMARGIHRPLIKGFSEAEILEGLRHAQFLAGNITVPGGRPVTELTLLELAADTRVMPEQVLRAETETIRCYVERWRQAEASGDYGLTADLDTLLSDETKNKEETEKLLRDLA